MVKYKLGGPGMQPKKILKFPTTDTVSGGF